MQQYIRVDGGVYGVADHNFIEDKNSQIFGFYNGGSGIGRLVHCLGTADG